MSAGGGNHIRAEVNRNEQAPRCGVATIEVADALEKQLTISGGNDEGVPPVPIPNTEVKPFSADGT